MTKRGRKPSYSPKLAVAVCAQIAQVGSIGKACAAAGLPRSTFYEWLHEHAEFVAMYQAAKEAYADDLFDKLADLMEKDPPRDEKGRGDAAFAHMARVRLDALKYRLRVLNPRKFAERVELTGGEGEPLNPPPQEMTPERLMEGVRRLAFILHSADAMKQPKADQPPPQASAPPPRPPEPAPMPLLPAPEAKVGPAAQDSGDEQPEYVVVGNRLVRSDIGGGLKDINGDGVLYDLGPPSYRFEE